jgi:protein gp37
MKQTKIDWCDCTINPVIGCKNGCTYCYARKINDRFHFVPNWNEPQFFPERLKQLNSKKPKSVFMNSMSDVSYWKEEWGGVVFEAMEKNKQHNYIMLTKSSSFFISEMPKNWYLGATIDTQKRCDNVWIALYNFLSIEPILEPIKLEEKKINNTRLKQIIIGAETGNRKGKVIPKKEWIDSLVKQADMHGIRVFMKESLRGLMGNDFRQDRLIWEVK